MNIPVNVQDVINLQLSQFYSVIAQERENRVKTRNWAITSLSAYIAILGSGKIYVDQTVAMSTLIIVICIFWIIEGFHQSLVLVNEGRVKLIEELLAKTNLPTKLPIELHYISGYQFINTRTKIIAFLRGTFTSEPIAFFYMAMIFISFSFVLFIYPIKVIDKMQYFSL